MQAQNTSERQKTKKHRQYPAPPTGTKTSGFSIAKEFFDLLLDHDVSYFNSLEPSSDCSAEPASRGAKLTRRLDYDYRDGAKNRTSLRSLSSNSSAVGLPLTAHIAAPLLDFFRDPKSVPTLQPHSKEANSKT